MDTTPHRLPQKVRDYLISRNELVGPFAVPHPDEAACPRCGGDTATNTVLNCANGWVCNLCWGAGVMPLAHMKFEIIEGSEGVPIFRSDTRYGTISDAP